MSFQVEPEALGEYADGTMSLAAKFGQLSELLEQARVDDECFGPLTAGWLGAKYYEGLEECKKMTDTAKEFLDFVAQGLVMTSASYSGTDDGIAQAFDSIADDLSGGK